MFNWNSFQKLLPNDKSSRLISIGFLPPKNTQLRDKEVPSKFQNLSYVNSLGYINSSTMGIHSHNAQTSRNWASSKLYWRPKALMGRSHNANSDNYPRPGYCNPNFIKYVKCVLCKGIGHYKKEWNQRIFGIDLQNNTQNFETFLDKFKDVKWQSLLLTWFRPPLASMTSEPSSPSQYNNFGELA